MVDGRKLILPAELRVCATCSYWDGARSHDAETKLVVVEHRCPGECLLREEQIGCTTPADGLKLCAWEPIESEPPSGTSATGPEGPEFDEQSAAPKIGTS